MKETLDKVADYEDWVKQKALKAGNPAFPSMFLISVGTIIIQLLLAVNLRLVLGETLIALVGGIVYAFIMVRNGIWDKGLSAREALWRDFLISVICAGIFSVLYGICLRRIIELLKEHGIAAFSQEAGASVAMHGASGFGMYGVDVLVQTDEAKKAL